MAWQEVGFWTRCAAGLAGFAIVATACAGGSDGVPDEALGMRVGGGLFDLEAFEAIESELGLPLRYTVQFTGRQTQRDMNGSAFGLLAADGADLPQVADRVDLSITVPLGFGRANAKSKEGRDEIEANFLAVLDGQHDEAYRRVGQRLVEGGFGDAIIRLGHEFNGAWAPWSSRTNEELYIAAYRHVHGLLRQQSPDFRFDWTAMRAGWVEWGKPAYPGDEFVDIVGLDVYWRTDTWSTDSWDRDYLSVLLSHQRFAAERDKPVSYPEWGVAGAESPEFVSAMHDWMATLPDDGPGRLVYHSYFNTNGEYALANYPRTLDTFVDLFGRS